MIEYLGMAFLIGFGAVFSAVSVIVGVVVAIIAVVGMWRLGVWLYWRAETLVKNRGF